MDELRSAQLWFLIAMYKRYKDGDWHLYRVARRNPDSRELARRLQAIRMLFGELHEANRHAVQAARFGLAHELTARIHELLWEWDENTFGSLSSSHSRRSCGLAEFVPADFAADYPAWLPRRVARLLSHEWVNDDDPDSELRRPVRGSLLHEIGALERRLAVSG